MRPGDVDGYDPEALRRYGPRLARLIRRWFRADVRGLEHLPDGPFLGVGNHSGAPMIPDTLVWLAAHHDAARATPLVTLAHDGMFDHYPARLAMALTRLGAVRASRDNALRALQRGYAVQVYPGGDQDACRRFADRNRVIFAGRTGYVRLAREAKAPIVPVVSAGAHEALFILWDGAPLARWLGLDRRLRLAAFPVALSVPWGLTVGPLPGYLPLPTKIVQRVLPPIDPHEGTIDEVDRRVRESMQVTLDALAAARRFPVIG